jgi:hypothetical protein
MADSPLNTFTVDDSGRERSGSKKVEKWNAREQQEVWNVADLAHSPPTTSSERTAFWYLVFRFEAVKLSFFSSFSFASSETRPPRGPESMNEVDTGKVTSVSLQGGADVVPWRKEIEAAIPSISISRQLKMDVPFAITCRRILLTTVTSSTISRKKF